MYVNFGHGSFFSLFLFVVKSNSKGIPTMIHGFLPQGMSINIIGENGILGVGPYPAPGKEDSEILNAGNVDF